MPTPRPIALACMSILSIPAFANNESFTAVLPTVTVEATADSSQTKGYIDYGEASVTRNGLSTKEIPQTIDNINIQRNKNYNTNDLSSILEGNAGIDTQYDMRGESIYLRGFQIDANDIYRDGIRESGQVRRSTASTERVEILKGPSSVLYGRTNGGGIVNLISKTASFRNDKNIGLTYGSWANRNLNTDLNHTFNPNISTRLIGEISKSNSFRNGIDQESHMISPSITLKNDDSSLRWNAQYLYDELKRTPDRSPSKTEYDKMGVSYRTAFAHPNDFTKDKLQSFRSDLTWQINPEWQLEWLTGYRSAYQNFDHYYGGKFDSATQKLTQNYAWQETNNKTLSSSLTLRGQWQTGNLTHQLTTGLDNSIEHRNPTLSYGSKINPLLKNSQIIDPYTPQSWTHVSPRTPATIRNQHRAISHGLFVQDLITFTPSIKFMLGGRYDQYRFRSIDINNNSREFSGHSFSPNIGIVWDTTPNHTLYASYNKSFSPYGGRSYLGVSSDSQAIVDSAPQHSRQYEVGLKSSWLQQRLSTTLSLYRLEHYNIRYRPDPNNNPYHWAVRGKERSQGLELSAIGQIIPKWYIRSSLGWLQAKIIEDHNTPTAEGRRLNGTSPFSGNIFVRYVPNQRFYGEAGITKIGSHFNYSTSNGAQTTPGFTRVDAMIGYQHKSWNSTLAVSNLFNKQYWRSTDMPGAPRTFTWRLNYTF